MRSSARVAPRSVRRVAATSRTTSSTSSASLSTAPVHETTTTAVPVTTPASAGLVGAWTADAHDLLAADLANLGGIGRVDCHGPITLRFGPLGGFTQVGTATCTLGARSGSAVYDTAGRYVVTGHHLSIAGVTARSHLTVTGRVVPLRGGLFAGGADYAISGSTLTITYTGATVGTIVQTYTRA